VSKTLVRILLADDHDVVRKGLRGLLEVNSAWQVCGEATNGRDAVKLAMELKPDLAVLDLEMPELNGLEATRQIKKDLPDLEVLIFTMHETDQFIRDALVAGARGFVLKADAGRYLVEAVEALSRHKPFFTSKASETLLEKFLESTAAPPIEAHRLTDREREIVQLLAEGKGNKEISAILYISVKTVETHRAAIMRKLKMNSIVDLVRYAIRNNWIKA
jgi:DNA-binding NarL/FixJ family response regulator